MASSSFPHSLCLPPLQEIKGAARASKEGIYLLLSSTFKKIEDGRMGKCEDVNMGRRDDGRMGRWEDGNIGIWMRRRDDGRMGILEDGRMGRWEDGII